MSTIPRRRRAEIAEMLRRRIVNAMAAGLSRRGDRLPSAREVAAEFDADPRLVLAAYRILAREGMVAIRRRSGIYVAAAQEVAGGPPVVAQGWLADVLLGGLEQGISAPRLGDWLRRCATSRRLRVAVVADTDDHLESFCGELRDDYGFDPVPFSPDAIDRPAGAPPEMLGADLVAAPEPYASALQRLLARSGKRVVTLDIRSEMDAVWRRMLQQGPMYAVLCDARTIPSFERMVGEYAPLVHPVLLGRDDVDAIPPDAAVYVTRAARRRLQGQVVPGRQIPLMRRFTAKTMRELLHLLVEANVQAMQSAAPAQH